MPQIELFIDLRQLNQASVISVTSRAFPATACLHVVVSVVQRPSEIEKRQDIPRLISRLSGTGPCVVDVPLVAWMVPRFA